MLGCSLIQDNTTSAPCLSSHCATPLVTLISLVLISSPSCDPCCGQIVYVCVICDHDPSASVINHEQFVFRIAPCFTHKRSRWDSNPQGLSSVPSFQDGCFPVRVYSQTVSQLRGIDVMLCCGISATPRQSSIVIFVLFGLAGVQRLERKNTTNL